MIATIQRPALPALSRCASSMRRLSKEGDRQFGRQMMPSAGGRPNSAPTARVAPKDYLSTCLRAIILAVPSVAGFHRGANNSLGRYLAALFTPAELLADPRWTALPPDSRTVTIGDAGLDSPDAGDTYWWDHTSARLHEYSLSYFGGFNLCRCRCGASIR